MKRIAVIEKDKCNPQGCGGYLCMKLCPVNRTGSDCIIIGEDGKPEIIETLCTGCGICPNRCPFGAIHIINLPEQLEEGLIHRYGRNGFHLFSLPIPIFGKVVGIIGVNAIGKSTAIRILAGLLQPNFGDARFTRRDIDRLIEHFRGTEAQTFFERLKNGSIRVSYKPQEVDVIPKQAEGTVRQLLKRVDEKSSMEKTAAELDIAEILDRDVSQISGGELQRVAIAATVLKDANLFIFDEPTSYLDIKQRLKISKFIRSLANEHTAVLLIEHDLIALDYMTDLIHIMYGKPAVYGAVSKPKPTKAGINTYLEGYLKEENMRFRDHKIRFEVRPPETMKQHVSLTSWNDVRLSLGSFSLEAQRGDIGKHDIVGVLGENGIGKTTFVRILAGIQKPDAGDVEQKVVVSYKPQKLESESGQEVAALLGDAVDKHSNGIMMPLNIRPLLEKRLKECSGGELQRVAIAYALSRDADLILLDEPSAYLDVEQRLIVARIIRELAERTGRTVLVVDHDLLFIDYLSDRLLVFDGRPAMHGEVHGPFTMEDGMNQLLHGLDITLRREMHSGRPRINKAGSQMDEQQKAKGKRYYT